MIIVNVKLILGVLEGNVGIKNTEVSIQIISIFSFTNIV